MVIEHVRERDADSIAGASGRLPAASFAESDVESAHSRSWECRCFRETRLVCRAMNDIIEENRATIGPMQVQRLFIGQHQAFDQGPKRFVVPDVNKLPNHLSSCAHSYFQQAFFYKVSLKTSIVDHLIRELLLNRVHIRGMIFYEVVFDCDGDVLVELFEASRIACLIMLECRLPGNLAEFLAHHEFVATIESHFIGSSDSFLYYQFTIIGSHDKWLKWFIEVRINMYGRYEGATGKSNALKTVARQIGSSTFLTYSSPPDVLSFELTLPSVTPDPTENKYVWRISSIRHELLRSVALNMEYCIYVFMFNPGVVSYFESFSLESSYR